jgi:predicted acetyltransferase
VRISVRLTPELREYGGHIGYDIRPTERGRGHATALLAAALRVAGGWGLSEALLTCASDNHASRRVIENNGGVLHDVSPAGRLRYWCRTIAER